MQGVLGSWTRFSNMTQGRSRGFIVFIFNHPQKFLLVLAGKPLTLEAKSLSLNKVSNCPRSSCPFLAADRVLLSIRQRRYAKGYNKGRSLFPISKAISAIFPHHYCLTSVLTDGRRITRREKITRHKQGAVCCILKCGCDRLRRAGTSKAQVKSRVLQKHLSLNSPYQSTPAPPSLPPLMSNKFCVPRTLHRPD